jgi:hypothetical protein
MVDLPVPQMVDSVNLMIPVDNVYDSIRVVLVQGTHSGAPATSWFNDFTGWSASAAHTPTEWTGRVKLDNTNDGTVVRVPLNAAGIAAVKAAMGVDSLRAAIITDRDIKRTITPTEDSYIYSLIMSNSKNPNLVIYYRFNPPGVTTVSDTLKAAALFVGSIDSTGGLVTSRGFKLWPFGATLGGDTVTVTQTGAFSTGNFSIYVDSLLTDSLYWYKAFAANPGYTTYGTPDTIRTSTQSTGTSYIYIDGRLIQNVQ